MLGGINDVVLREGIDREGWRDGIHADCLAAAHGVTRRVFAADVDRPGAIAQRLRVGRGYVNAPRPVSAHHGPVGFTVQRYGKFGALRQILAGAGERKACGLLAGVKHVIARRGGQRNGGLGGRDRYGDIARIGSLTAVDLHHRPGVFPVRLGR